MEEHRPDTKTPPDEESVFSRIMNSSVHDGGKIIPRSDQKVAILIVCNQGHDSKRVLETLDGMTMFYDSMTHELFNPDYGSPVIYFP